MDFLDSFTDIISEDTIDFFRLPVASLFSINTFDLMVAETFEERLNKPSFNTTLSSPEVHNAGNTSNNCGMSG